MHPEGYKEVPILRFETHTAHVAIIGLGDGRLPLAVSDARAGYRVTGIDLDSRTVDAINRGEFDSEDVPSVMVAEIRGCFGSG